MDDLTKELWQGTAERGRQPEPVDLPPLLLVEPTLRVADKSGWREFLGSRKFGLMLALACILGLLGIASANPFASPSVSERVSEKLGQPATCTERGATVTADSHETIYRCAVVSMNTQRAVRCFVVSGRDIRQLSGRRGLGCLER